MVHKISKNMCIPESVDNNIRGQQVLWENNQRALVLLPGGEAAVHPQSEYVSILGFTAIELFTENSDGQLAQVIDAAHKFRRGE